MTGYIQDNGLLPSDLIDRLSAATPTTPLAQTDFLRLGFNNWQDWLNSICSPVSSGRNEAQLRLQLP